MDKKDSKQVKYVPPLQSIGPTFPPFIKPVPRILKSNNLIYFALGDGKKMVFTNSDAVPQLSTSEILDPKESSYINLFINGFLQPTVLYTVEKGCLILLTNEVPSVDVPIMLQFIVNYI
ncbi:DUF4183 domain-containing protein [Bacillus cereus]|uniref:DUF4183 domain-containing protein n=1 Tax=Bacillus cereus TaxID=1396 RepID=UPI000BECE6CC|nr:DUF4183 domain-containing protein [Bacillus cereus]PEF60669.1 hypothetical protein CON35_29600 [Bacillus cereus]